MVEKNMKKAKAKKNRVYACFNTGTRIHKSSKDAKQIRKTNKKLCYNY